MAGEGRSSVFPCGFPNFGETISANTASQQQPLLFPSVTIRGSNVLEQSSNAKGAPLDWLTNFSYEGHSTVENRSESLVETSQEPDMGEDFQWKKDFEGTLGEQEDQIHSPESVSSCDGETDNVSRHRKHKEKWKKHKVHKHKHRHKHKEEHKSRKQLWSSKNPKELVSKPDTTWIDEVNLPPNEAFRVSRKPDLGNRMYDTLYRLDVALYRIKPNVSCLGLKRHQAVQLYEQKGKIKRKKIQEVVRYWNKDGWSSESEIVRSRTETAGINLNFSNYSYVPLELPEKAPDAENLQDTETSRGEDKDANLENYISQRTVEFNKILRENPHHVSTWITFVKFQEEAVQQGEMLKVHFTEARNDQRKKASIVVIEKKISIYEKALEHNPDSIELITGHLQLCSEVWSAEQLAQRWKKVMFLHPNKTALWKKYVLFSQSCFSLFSFSKVVSVYHKCLETLSAIKEGAFTSHKQEGDVEADMLDLFVQQCHFMRQAGHMEKAVSCFQALIELTCFCPQDLEHSTSLKGRMEFLETFWDSEAPRFGEDGAVGWKNWMTSSVSNKTASSSVVTELGQIFKATEKSMESRTGTNNESVIFNEDLTQWQAWLKVEISRENNHWKPWQPDKEAGETEEDCEDPERLVLFDDVSSSLFNINSLINKFRLVLQFLLFLGVPLPLVNSTVGSQLGQYLTVCLEHKQQILEIGQGQRLGLLRVCEWTSRQFANENTTTPSTCTWPPQHVVDVIRNVFAQSLGVFEGNPNSFLMSMWLGFEFELLQQETEPKVKKRKFKDFRKLAKSLLRLPSNRNDLVLWQSFAEVEWLAGNVAEARRILDSTLAMSWDVMSEDEGARNTVISLFRCYAELEVGLVSRDSSVCQSLTPSATNRALHILTSFAEGDKFQPLGDSDVKTVSPIRVLKAQKQFNQLISHVVQDFQNRVVEGDNSTLPMLGSGQAIGIGSVLVHLVACHALFQYLTSDFKEMCLVFDGALSAIADVIHVPDGAAALDIELIWTAYVRLLRYHSERHAMPLKDVRRVMLGALHSYPENPEFLSFYVQLEARSNVSVNIRRFFDKNIQVATSPIPWILSVIYEQNRSAAVMPVTECSLVSASVGAGDHSGSSNSCCTTLPVTGITHRQRSILDKVAAHPTTRHCVALWRMYIQFEIECGSQERARAVFYQALQHCPWAKVLYLDAVRHFPDDLQSTLDLMEEKEIRVRAPLEELQLLMQ